MTVFISHASEGRELARRLEHDLRQRGLDTFSDQAIQPGEQWAAQLTEWLRSAEDVVAIVSEDSKGSRAQGSELALALAEEKRVIPVLSQRRASMPFFLSRFQALDLSDPRDYESNLDRLVTALRSKPAEPPPSDIETSRLAIDHASLELQKSKLAFEGTARGQTRWVLLATVATLFATTAAALFELLQKQSDLVELAMNVAFALVAGASGFALGRRSESPRGEKP